MGKLKPVGSEKLQGMDKIKRMIEIARYKENVPNSINENTSLEYKKVLSDGNTYQIVKEKNGYVIKSGLNESVSEYIEPMKHRRYYSSYSQALKRLNIIAKEVNSNIGYDKNVSLFTESEEDDSKYFLTQTNEQETPAPATPAPATPAPATPAPAPAPEMGTEMPTGGEESPEPTDSEMPTGEDELPEPLPEEGDEEEVTYKSIQKLVGKLGQKIRTFLSNEENQMSSKDIKYVINSVLSALNLESLEDEDKESIMAKFEGQEEGEEEDIPSPDEAEGEEDIPSPDEAEGMETPAPETPQPEGEMAEYEDSEDSFDFMNNAKNMDKEEQKSLVKSFFTEEDDIEDEYPRHGRNAKRRKIKHLNDDDSEMVGDMIEGLFSESKVENVLRKYFKLEEKERLMVESKKEKIKRDETKSLKTKKIVEKLSENVSQEVASKKLINKYPSIKFLGKNNNNGSLIFEMNNRKLRVTPKGSII